VRKGFTVFPFAIVFILIVIAFVLVKLSSKTIKPTAQQEQLAQDIEKYPNSSNWVREIPKATCTLFNFDGCPSPQIIFKFESKDSRSDIIKYYVYSLRKKGWNDRGDGDNSAMITDLRTSLQIDGKNGCLGFLGNQGYPNAIPNKYEFILEC